MHHKFQRVHFVTFCSLMTSFGASGRILLFGDCQRQLRSQTKGHLVLVELTGRLNVLQDETSAKQEACFQQPSSLWGVIKQ